VACRKLTAVFVEAVVVVLAGAGFAFAANELSPHGLFLARDYFPKSTNVVITSSTPPVTSSNAAAPSVATNENPEIAEADQRIRGKGLQPLDLAEVEKLFHDPRYMQGLVIFIDARTGGYYATSHITGAYPLDYYHPEKDLAADIAPCDNAEQVVVYCSGGECEDADSTAIMLQKSGVPAQKIFVYSGGFDEWSAKHLPLEQGARNSGVEAK
jgi:rhodanese-related sulfurtransferase